MWKWSIVYRDVSEVILFNIVFLSLKVNFVLTNSVVPGKMPHYAAFHLGLHCLQNYAFVSQEYAKA